MNALMQFGSQLVSVLVVALIAIQISLMLGYYWVALVNALMIVIVGLGACLQYMQQRRR